MVEAKRARRRHVSAFSWAAGLTVLLGLLDVAELSQKPPLIQVLGLVLVFALTAGFWEIVHLLTRDKLLGRDRDADQ